MFVTDNLEVWNLTPNHPVCVGAQKIFNVVGRLKAPKSTRKLLYRLNQGPEKTVFFNSNVERLGRLANLGDFNIDTIAARDLKPINRLTFRILNGCPEPIEHQLAFMARSFRENLPRFRLNLDGIDYPSQIGQVVEGKWQVSRDDAGEPCLEIRKEDAGLDRIILFGRDDWSTGYEITARFCVTSWTKSKHNVGIVFKWNPHDQGDGTCLPTRWSTGLGYYSSHCPGLRIRFGVNVHLDQYGNKCGDYIMQEAKFSSWRWWAGRVGNRVLHKLLGMENLLSQIVPGVQYRIRMQVNPEKYTLSLWKAGNRESPPQLVVRDPIDRLPHGSVGIIAHYCGLRVYEFNVSPRK